ncbi:MAG: hypothetical protein IKZ58_06685 [Selenomonadaceae bacterium]|nr:hypothetical protein [Selenomonadaceae bacterium]
MKKFFFAVMILALMIPNICGASAIQTWKIDGEYHAVYPSVDPDVDVSELPIYNKIGDKIREVLQDFWNSVEVTGGFIKSNLNYEITCDKDNILSIVFTSTMKFADKPSLYEKDAYGNEIPFMYKQTLNFDMRTGDFIEPDNLKNLSNKYNCTPQDILKKLQAYAKANNFELSPEINNLQIIPQRYYIDENLHLHFIFAGYEISPTLKYYDFIDIDITK